VLEILAEAEAYLYNDQYTSIKVCGIRKGTAAMRTHHERNLKLRT